MENSKEDKSLVEQAGEDLFTFAADRQDIKTFIANLPEQAKINQAAAEYELQLLKIISVGWGITYYLENSIYKETLASNYWLSIQQYSKSVSEAAGLMVGAEIDYFQIVKDRLDMYVAAMNENPSVSEPALVIGPKFAGACNHRDDVFAVMLGSRMFIGAIASVKDYLNKIKLLP